MSEFIVAVIKDSQILGHDHTLLENLFTDHMVLYYMKGLCRLLYSICHIPGRRSKEKRLEKPWKYNYYYGSTKNPVFIQDLAFIFVTCCYPGC